MKSITGKKWNEIAETILSALLAVLFGTALVLIGFVIVHFVIKFW